MPVDESPSYNGRPRISGFGSSPSQGWEGAIASSSSTPPVLLSLKNAQLVAKGQNLELELGTAAKPDSYDHGRSRRVSRMPRLYPDSANRRNFCGGRDFHKAQACVSSFYRFA